MSLPGPGLSLGPFGSILQPHQGAHGCLGVGLALNALPCYLGIPSSRLGSSDALQSNNYVKLNISEVGLPPPSLVSMDSCHSLLTGLPASPLIPSEPAQSPARGLLSLRTKAKPLLHNPVASLTLLPLSSSHTGLYAVPRTPPTSGPLHLLCPGLSQSSPLRLMCLPASGLSGLCSNILLARPSQPHGPSPLTQINLFPSTCHHLACY